MRQSLLFSFALLLFCSTGQASRRDPELDKAISHALAAEYKEALAIFQALLTRTPDDSLLNYYAGVSCLRLARLDHGIGYLEKSIQEKAPFPQAYAWLGEAYLEKKSRDKAKAIVEQGLKLFPRNKQLLDLMQRLSASS